MYERSIISLLVGATVVSTSGDSLAELNFFYMPCLSQTIQPGRLFVSSGSVAFLPRHFTDYVVFLILWRHLNRFPIMFPVDSIVSSNLFFLVIWPVVHACLVLISLVFLFGLAVLTIF